MLYCGVISNDDESFIHGGECSEGSKEVQCPVLCRTGHRSLLSGSGDRDSAVRGRLFSEPWVQKRTAELLLDRGYLARGLSPIAE